MAGEWEETVLADVSSDVSYGYTESATDEKVGPRFLRITDIQNGVVNWANVPYCPISTDNHQKYRLQEGDIVVARTGNSTGENFLYRGGEDAVFASYLIRFRIDRKKADPGFVWYNLRSRDWWNFINNSKTGSAQAGANAKILGLFPLNLPPLAEQRAIAHILGTLDDKIELNRRMRQTLEAMARGLFKSWFIDFDPVRRNADRGRNQPSPRPTSHPSPNGRRDGDEGVVTGEAYDHLFPDSFEDSELGEIPKGWETGPFAGTIEIFGGGTPKTSSPECWNGAIPWFSVADAPSDTDVWVIDTEKKITEAGIENSSAQILPVGTTIITARGTVGRIALVGVPMAMNQSCYGVCGKTDIHGYYTYFATRQLVSSLQQRAHGSVFDTITRDTFAGVTVVILPPHLVEAFEKIVSPILEHIRAGLFVSGTLTALRDTLQPKLISGELRVTHPKILAEVMQ